MILLKPSSSSNFSASKRKLESSSTGDPLKGNKNVYSPETLPEKYQQNLLLSDKFRKLFILYLCNAQYGISHYIDSLMNRLWSKGYEGGMSFLEKKSFNSGQETEIKGPRKLFWTINENLLSNRIVLEKLYKNGPRLN